MLRKGDKVPYASSLVTIIWKEEDEWKFDNTKTAKRNILYLDINKRPKEIMCCWTGQWRTDVFQIDWDKFEESMS